jgi:phosphoglucosamine mutase
MGDGRNLFGTDGVRGPVGEKLTPELALALGRATAAEIEGDRPQVLIIRDTRESGHMLESALAAGMAAAGADVFLGGVLPTPAAAILVRRHGFDLSAVVSASHNPWGDNGIKFFDSSGRKLDDDAERRVEAHVAAGAVTVGTGSGRIRKLEGAMDDYLREIASAFDLDLAGRKIVLDCANGATYRVAPAAFDRLGADVIAIATEPDGRNINEGCGSTDPGLLAERVRAVSADAGLAVDGDADRVVAVDASGRVVDGDHLMAICALDLAARDLLAERTVVVTVMTNLGFRLAMAERGISVIETKVGDRYVLEALDEGGLTIGGEQSGHVIFRELATTGDGTLTGLQVLDLVRRTGRRLAQLADDAMTSLPQVLRNVRVAERGVDVTAAIAGELAAVEAELGDHGRVLIRPSGTEPLVRVMVEAPTEEQAESAVTRLVAAVEAAVGA